MKSTLQATQEVKDQLEKIREEGRSNMLDFNCVHRIAYDAEMFALVNWMQENKSLYGKLIMMGWDE